jgi:hypothetical protein
VVVGTALELARQLDHRLLGAAARPIAVAAVQEVLFVDRAQQRRAGQLHELVFQCRNTQRSLLSVLFGDQHAPDQLGPVAFRLHALGQIGEVRFQVACVDLCRQPVDTTGRVLVQVVPAVHQQLDIHLSVEVAKAMVLALLRSIGYSPQ